MNNINTFVISGRVTHDLGARGWDYGATPSGLIVGQLSIASNRNVKKGDEWKEEASFFPITIFGKMAEGLKPYLTKGRDVTVEGHIEQARWEKDGKQYQKINLIADRIELHGGKKDGTASNESGDTVSQESNESDDDLMNTPF